MNDSQLNDPLNRGSSLEKRWVHVLLYLGFWTMLGLFNTGQSYFLRASLGRPTVFWKALVLGLSDWYFWAALAPIVMWLARRYPLEQRVWVKHCPIHFVLALFGALLTTLVLLPVMHVVQVELDPSTTLWQRIPRYFVGEAHLYALVYWAILGVTHAIDYYRKFREREWRASQLEGRLAQAQLQVLKMQLDPHFLFNTLNAVSSLIHSDPDGAEKMLARLGDMLRSSLDSAGTHEVSLRQELRTTQPYLEIQRIRFGNRLSVSLDIEPPTLEAAVPNLILQPIVENAVRHGIEPTPCPGRIAIRSCRDGNWLKIEIRDNGPGLPNTRPVGARTGVGIANTRARLNHLYGQSHRFEIANASEGGAVVTLSIPWHAANRAGTPAENEP